MDQGGGDAGSQLCRRADMSSMESRCNDLLEQWKQESSRGQGCWGCWKLGIIALKRVVIVVDDALALPCSHIPESPSSQAFIGTRGNSRHNSSRLLLESQSPSLHGRRVYCFVQSTSSVPAILVHMINFRLYCSNGSSQDLLCAFSGLMP